MKNNIILLGLLIFTLSGISQNTKIYVKNSENSIRVKWYSKQLVYENGVNIYRKTEGTNNWIKLNTKPIIKKEKIADKYIQADSSLLAYMDIIDEISSPDFDGFSLLNCLVKSIQSPEFANYLGISFTDKTIIPGETYSYKIMEIYNGVEKLQGESKLIIADQNNEQFIPENIDITPGHHKASIKWKPDEDNYYAVNIYRSSNLNSQKVKANKLPIMLSSFTNKEGEEQYADYFFVDDSLQNDVIYYYELKGIDFFNEEMESSEIIEVEIKDLMPPLPPSNIRKSIDKYSVGISWDKSESEDLKGYNIYRSPNDKDNYKIVNKKILKKTDTTFVEKIEKSGYYYYKVAAIDNADNVSFSNKLLLKVEDNTPPNRPQFLKAVADTGKISLSWKMNTEEDLIGFLVYRKIKTEKQKDFVLITPEYIATNEFIDNRAKNIRNIYEYKIVAVDSALNISEFSNIVSAQMTDVIPPEKPFIKNVISQERGVQVQWIQNVELDLKGYNIYRIFSNDTLKLNSKIIEPKMHLFTDRTAIPDEKYLYAIKAIDKNGNTSAFSNLFPGMYKSKKLNSSKIISFNVKGNSKRKQIRVHWNINKNDEFKGIVVSRKQDNQTFKPLTGILKGDEYVDKDVKFGIKYYYKIKVFENSGSVIASDTVKIEIIDSELN